MLSAFALTTLAALIVEAGVGYPDRLYRAVGHPVTHLGALIDQLDARLNDPCATPGARRRRGALALAAVLGAALAVGALLQVAAGLLPFGALLVALPASSLLAQRSLHAHVAAVAAALSGPGGLAAGRAAVGHIVGRDTAALDEAAVCRAAIESLAENASDGVFAPALWLLIGGLPGGLAYKAINTADSMIGHRTLRYAAFGMPAARLDDLVNLPASRLSGCLFALAAPLAGGSAAGAVRAMLADASRHRSPNAGWPEAAMAGALGLSLSGPRSYHGVPVDDAVMGHGRRDAAPADILRALRLFRVADALFVAVVATLLAALLA